MTKHSSFKIRFQRVQDRKISYAKIASDLDWPCKGSRASGENEEHPQSQSLQHLGFGRAPGHPPNVQDEVDGQVVEINFHFTHNYIKSVNKDNFMAEVVEIWIKVEIDEEYEAMKTKKLVPIFKAQMPEVLVKDKEKKSEEFKTKLRGETEDEYTQQGTSLGPDGSSSTQNLEDIQEVAVETEGAAVLGAQLGGTEQEVLPSTCAWSSGRNVKQKTSDAGATREALKKIRIVLLMKAR
ncbi:hypothetical protein C8J56DRAFT_893161 [Mycena floridula]|nr:hypothetical protein C8J56DRAFT_893161 [Mycena floridula]